MKLSSDRNGWDLESTPEEAAIFINGLLRAMQENTHKSGERVVLSNGKISRGVGEVKGSDLIDTFFGSFREEISNGSYSIAGYLNCYSPPEYHFRLSGTDEWRERVMERTEDILTSPVA